MITGISRMRNESLILEDTLKHFLKYCDNIVIYDDCSTDNSVEIMESFDNVKVVKGLEWLPDPWKQQTQQRKKALHLANSADMVLCFDADERLVGDLPTKQGGYTLGLYDGYMTKEHQKPYKKGDLSQIKRLWGIERRDILMFFDPRGANYHGNGQREPNYTQNIQKSDVLVKHYGKCLSVEHWEETCTFYSKYFPQWSEKWENRKGKAIHTQSDFKTDLITWNQIENLNHR